MMPDDTKPPAPGGATSAPAAGMADTTRVDVTSLLSLPRFDGTDSLRRFIDNYDRYARLQGWDDGRKLDVLPLTLSGIARDAFDGLPAVQLTSYAGVVEGLKSAFTKASVADHLLALRKLRYSDEEPLDAFVIRFKKLVKLAFPFQVDLSPLLFSHFLVSLSPEYYAAVIADGVSTFDAAVSKVRNLQSSRAAVTSSPSASTFPVVTDQLQRTIPPVRPQPACDSVRRLESEPSVVDALTKRVAELEARLASVTSPSQRPPPTRDSCVRGDVRSPVVCYCCGRTGHVRNRCRLRRCKCFLCGGDSHIASVCPRKYQENDPGSGRQQGVNGRTQ